MVKELEYLLGKVVVFDIDGTLMRYDFGKRGNPPFDHPIKGFLPDEWIDINVKRNLYVENGRPTTLFQEVVKELGNDAWVLSVALTSFEQQNKIKAISEFYPTIPLSHILFVADSKYKIPVMESMVLSNKLGNEGKSVVLVDDRESLVYDFVALNSKNKESSFELKLLSDFV